jgi:hypothetical protein
MSHPYVTLKEKQSPEKILQIGHACKKSMSDPYVTLKEKQPPEKILQIGSRDSAPSLQKRAYFLNHWHFTHFFPSSDVLSPSSK